MENKAELYKIVVSIEKKLNSWQYVHDDLMNIVLIARKHFQLRPRSSFEVSIPYNIIKKDVKDKLSQTEISFMEEILVEQREAENIIKNANQEGSKDLKTDTNDTEAKPDCSIHEAVTPDVFDFPDLTEDFKKMIKMMQVQKMGTENSDSEVKPDYNIPTTVDENLMAIVDEAFKAFQKRYNVAYVINTPNYTNFSCRIFLSLMRLNSSPCSTKGINEKLNKISTFFDDIVSMFLCDNKTTIETCDKETNTVTQPEKTVDPSIAKTNAEIELQLQLIKQERKDDEEIETARALLPCTPKLPELPCTPKLPELLPTIEKAPTPLTSNLVTTPRVETFSQPKKVQTPIQTEMSTNYTYEQYPHLYMGHGQSMNNNHGLNFAKNIRMPMPPTQIQNIVPTQPQCNQNYYTNQESTNKSHRYSSKKPYSRQSSPYQRYPQQTNQVSIQQPTQNQQYFHPYIHQQNLQGQGQMYPPNIHYQ